MKKLKLPLNARRRKFCAAVVTLTATAVWAASPEITVEKGSPREEAGGGGEPSQNLPPPTTSRQAAPPF